MDKLKPILDHKFWVLFGVFIPLALAGWFLGTSGLAGDFERRKSAIDSAINGVPSNPNLPNTDWSEKLKKLNADRQRALKESHRLLWEMQAELMVWPADIRDLMADVPFRGAIPNAARDLYRSSYFLELRRVWNIARPFDPRTGEGNVLFDIKSISPQVPENEWAQLPPTTKQTWEVQEDLWLLTALMQSIAAVNEDAGSITDAAVRRIDKVELRGGSRNRDQAGAGDGGEGEGTAGGDEMMGIGGGSRFGRGGGRQDRADADFSPEEEFGSAAAAAASGGGEADASGGDGGDAMGGAGRQQKQDRRYIDDNPELPYKTRGFYLKVVMDHRKLPNLLVQLTNSKWPVEIVRVHQTDLYDDSGRSTPQGGGGIALGNFGADDGDAGFGVPMGGGRRPAAGNTQDGQRIANAALADPYLTTVVIAGVMTLYQPPEAEAEPDPNDVPAEEFNEFREEVPPAGDDPADSGQQPDPASFGLTQEGVDDGTAPADPVPAADADPGEAVDPLSDEDEM